MPCDPRDILNPASGRCVARSGKIGQSLLGLKLEPCAPMRIRNPASGRCVARSGKIGQALLGGRKAVALSMNRDFDFTDGTSLSLNVDPMDTTLYVSGSAAAFTALTARHRAAMFSQDSHLVKLEGGLFVKSQTVRLPGPVTVGQLIDTIHNYYARHLTTDYYTKAIKAKHHTDLGMTAAQFRQRHKIYADTMGDHVWVESISPKGRLSFGS